MAKAKVEKLPKAITVKDVPYLLHKKFKSQCNKNNKTISARVMELIKQDVEI